MKAESAAKDFPVVCVGGSAGGLDAYTRLLRHLPVNMGVAVVIVNHLRISLRKSYNLRRWRLKFHNS
jgi:chemotaxis response regulator CheB